MKETTIQVKPNGPTGEFQSDSKLELQNKQTKKLITLKGYTTSQINQALKANNPYPARVFLKIAENQEDIPIFFRIKENNSWIRPKIKTGSYLQAAGNYSQPTKSSRKSFTAYSYQLLTPTPSLKAQQLTWEREYLSHEW